MADRSVYCSTAALCLPGCRSGPLRDLPSLPSLHTSSQLIEPAEGGGYTVPPPLQGRRGGSHLYTTFPYNSILYQRQSIIE